MKEQQRKQLARWQARSLWKPRARLKRLLQRSRRPRAKSLRVDQKSFQLRLPEPEKPTVMLVVNA